MLPTLVIVLTAVVVIAALRILRSAAQDVSNDY